VERLATSADPILEAVRRMGRWIDQLSDLARTQIGQPLRLDRQPTELVSLAEQITAEHQRTSGAHRVQVVSEVPQLIGDWDRARLERLLDNLLGNAIKYSPRGGEITLTIHLERPDGEDGWAVLRLRDEGVGIPAADLPYIFEPFRRAGNVAPEITGTGIGLVSARQAVEAHGGTITVQSEAGKGSTFTVRLPLAPPAAPALNAPNAPNAPRESA
jgi:signal transduction histidine kinase